MRSAQVRLYTVLMLLAASLLAASKAHASFPYKIVISGLGLDHAITLWLTTDDDLIRAMQGGLNAETFGLPPDDTKAIFEIDWYWGACWVKPTPCTDDPDPYTVFRTQYYFDPAQRHGYLHYLDRPGYIDQVAAKQWLRVATDFDEHIQRILAENGAKPEVSIWI